MDNDYIIKDYKLIIAMLILILIKSTVRLKFDFSTLIVILKFRENAVFDSFNFFYELFLLPIDFLTVLGSLIIMTIILKRKKIKYWYIYIPNLVIVINLLSYIFFSPGLKNIILFEIRFVIDYIISIFLSVISILGVYSSLKIIKTKR